MAACAIANIVKSSLGPVGLDKMLVDDIGVCIFVFSWRYIKYKCNRYVIEYVNYNFSRMSPLPMMVQPSCVC